MEATKDLYKIPMNCDFKVVGNNDSIEYECSPKLTDRFFSKFKGLLINTPSEIIWPSNVKVSDYQSFPNGNNESPIKFMLSGLAHVPDSIVKNDTEIAYEVLVVAVNQETAVSYSGKMKKLGSIGILPELESNMSNPPEILRKHFFNIDLIENLGIPVVEATYTVYATIGVYKSNVTKVNTKIKN